MSNISNSELLNLVSGSDITGESTYDIWRRLGNPDNVQEFLDFMRTGVPGKSAYDLWLEEGNDGSVEDFLVSLKGAQGEAGAQGIPGEPGLEGKSAYQSWLDLGNEGTEADFIAFLKADQEQAFNNHVEEFNTHKQQVLYYEIEDTLIIPDITVNDDGKGNVVVEATGMEIADDSNGNISILSDNLSVSDDGLGNITINL